MDVKLLTYTPEPEKVVAAAARICYSNKCGADLMDNFSQQEVENFIARLVNYGHMSPFEHASFTFAVDGVSRALSHQLVRHRIGVSFSQKSQRYVKEKQFEYVTPDTITKKKELAIQFANLMAVIQEKYNDLVAAGIPAEDARYLLPNATVTNLVVTMNARSLLHFFELRCCVRAQKEIRQMANLMLCEVRKVAPGLFSNAGPTCVSSGICFEGDMSCKKPNVIVRHRQDQQIKEQE